MRRSCCRHRPSSASASLSACLARPRHRGTHTVVFLRHGESLWNVEKRYTGWCDVPLTSKGEADAADAGNLMRERGLKFDLAFTSNLQRAWKSCEIALSSLGQRSVPTVRSWKLNERHYGLLQGHYKDCQALNDLFGEEQLVRWRRSYFDTPPSMNDPDLLKLVNQNTLLDSKRFIKGMPAPPAGNNAARRMYESSLKHLELPFIEHCPSAESLKDCEIRAYGYWNEVISPAVKRGKRVLVVAHANTIRSLVKVIDDISDDAVQHLRIPNGVPLVYCLDNNMKPSDILTDDIGFQANYLVSTRNHSKMMEYERCFVRKMRSLFQYFDADGDGVVSTGDIHRGLSKLRAYRDNDLAASSSEDRFFCDEEELLRSFQHIKSPSDNDGETYTLESFLQAEDVLRPTLNRLKLLE